MSRRWSHRRGVVTLALVVFFVLPACTQQTPTEAVAIYCSVGRRLPVEYHGRWAGRSMWIRDQVEDEEMVQKFLVIDETDDPVAQIDALEALVDRYGLSECEELDYLREHLEESQRGYEALLRRRNERR